MEMDPPPVRPTRTSAFPGFDAIAGSEARRRRLVADLAARRHALGLSQTEVAARMGTSQSAVARLEAGDGDLRLSTLDRYAAAVRSEVAWQVQTDGSAPGSGVGGPSGGETATDRDRFRGIL